MKVKVGKAVKRKIKQQMKILPLEFSTDFNFAT
jgi:hypothetical protein